MTTTPTTIEIVSIVLGTLSLLVSIVGVVYAFAAAKRSDQVLRRLVVYPFRDLDRKYSELTNTERSFLKDYARLTGLTSNRTTPESVEVLVTSSTEYSSDLVDYLANRNWLVSHRDGRFSLNADRLPYFAFIIEAEDRKP